MPRASAAPLSVAAAAALLALAGCGGDGGGAATTAATAPPPTATPKSKSQSADNPGEQQPSKQQSAETSPPTKAPEPGPPASDFEPTPHHDSGGGAEQFIVKGADNSVQEFGVEAPESELEQAATALHSFLDARAERNWAAACTYLSAATKRGFAELGSSSAPQGCAATLAALTGKTPTATLREAAIADVGSLRREGGRGFLIYRGAPQGTVYAIPVARQGGEWKLTSLAATPLN